MAFATANFSNTSSQEELIDMYLTINGTTSSITKQTIIRNQTGSVGYAPITIFRRTSAPVSPGTYGCDVYAFTESTTSGVNCDHIDIALIGNLADYNPS